MERLKGGIDSLKPKLLEGLTTTNPAISWPNREEMATIAREGQGEPLGCFIASLSRRQDCPEDKGFSQSMAELIDSLWSRRPPSRGLVVAGAFQSLGMLYSQSESNWQVWALAAQKELWDQRLSPDELVEDQLEAQPVWDLASRVFLGFEQLGLWVQEAAFALAGVKSEINPETPLAKPSAPEFARIWASRQRLDQANLLDDCLSRGLELLEQDRRDPRLLDLLPGSVSPKVRL